jgi:hypothetical protein
MMEIKNMKNKVKIIFEYPKKIIGFGTITEKDLEKLSLRIFLNDGTEIYPRQIKQITFKLEGN